MIPTESPPGRPGRRGGRLGQGRGSSRRRDLHQAAGGPGVAATGPGAFFAGPGQKSRGKSSILMRNIYENITFFNR